jgi:hypothetical protein
MRAVTVVTIALVSCAAQVAQKSAAADKAPEATRAYNARISAIASNALAAELSKHSERLSGVSMKLQYSVDLHGRVHNVRIVSTHPDRWAEKTAARVLANTKFPPIPKDVLQDLGGKDHIKAEAELSYEVKPVDAPNASLVILPSKGCAVAILAVDDHHFKSPQKQVSVPPGRHVLLLHVTEMGPDKGYADAPLEETFEPDGRYSITGILSMEKGTFFADFVNEKKRPRRK